MADERGGRYFREARFFLAGDKVVAQSHILEARSLMGYMRDQLAMGGPPIQVQYATLGDGTVIRATMMNGQFQAQIASPSPQPYQPEGEAYEIWVRPSWSSSYDWVVVDHEGCDVTTERRDPIVYSNRLWQAPDLSIYCIINGHDQDKYFGTAGDTVAKDGVLLAYYGAGVVGVAAFMGRLVVVQRTDIANSETPVRAQCKYKVFVNGVEKLETDLIDSYVDGGYSVLHDQYVPAYGVERRFSQTTVTFNQAGSEGACVLGNAAVIVFSLADMSGDTSVSYGIEAIPYAQATYHQYHAERIDSDIGCTDHLSPPIWMTITYDETRITYRQEYYEVAMACDYTTVSGIEQRVYLMLHDVGDKYLSDVQEYTTTKIGVYDAQATLSDTAIATKTYSADSINRLYYSTGETIYTWSDDTLRNLAENSFYSYWEDINIAENVHLVGLDIKHGFSVIHSTKQGTQSKGQVTFTYHYPVTITQSADYTEEVFYAGSGDFIGGFAVNLSALEVQYGPTSLTTHYTVPDAYHGSYTIPGCPYYYPSSEHSLNVTVDNSAVRTDARARYPLLTTEYPYYDTRLFDCFAMPFPDKDSNWNRALVFLRVPTYPEDYVSSTAEAHVVCAEQAVDISDQFIEVNPTTGLIDHPDDSEPVTRHSGIIRKRT